MSEIYSVDLETGLLSTTISDTGEVIQATLEDLSNGRLSLEGTRIRDRSTGRFVTSLSSTRPNYIEQLGSGTLLLQLPKSTADINSAIAANGMDAISLSYTVELPDGRTFEHVLDHVSVTPISGVIIAKETGTGQFQFQTLVPEIDTLTGDILNMPEGFRLASPDEAMQRAITGYLMSALREDMDVIAGAHIQDENGNYLESAYEVAAWIAKHSFSDLVGLQLRQI